MPTAVTAAPISPCDRGTVGEAIAHADLRVLLMVLFHLTADRKWLAFRPKRDVKLIADEDAGLSKHDQQLIREAAVELLLRGAAPRIGDPGEALMVEMMAICLGERVAPEYANLMREEMGFLSRDYAWTHDVAPANDTACAGSLASVRDRHRVVIVGSGVSGIALGARLVRLGIDFVLLERHHAVGGVWHENQYPGCAVDTPNHAYSFSFAPPYPWPRYFSAREEIVQYLEEIAEQFGVRQKIRFNSTVTSARWDEASGQWLIAIETPSGPEILEATLFVPAIGQFGEPLTPQIEGAKDFAGPLFHSAQWPQEFEANGRRVALIGAGASAMQIAPTIAAVTARLTIFQRTAQWARPVARYHEQIPPQVQWLLKHVPCYAGWFRFTMWWRYGDGLLKQLKRDPGWPHPDRSINRRNDLHRQEMTSYILAALAGRPDLIAKSIPDYPPFAKRILLDNGWYEAIKRENVELVTQQIRRITRGGIQTVDGVEHAVEAIVLATGFRISPLAARLNISGRGGRTLFECWAPDNPTAYLGIAVPGFPNMFMMQGPNTGLAHGGSAIFQAESQARYISGMIVRMCEAGIGVCDVKESAHEEFVRLVDREHEHLIWTHPGVSNYYKNSTGRIFSAMPFRLVDYWRMTHEPKLEDFQVDTRLRQESLT